MHPLDTLRLHLQTGLPPRPRPLFAGLAPALLARALDAAVFSAVFSAVRLRLRALFPHRLARLPIAALSAAAAGLASTAVEAPLSLAAARARLGFARPPWRGLYAAAAVGLARDMPFEMVEFAGYEAFKAAYVAAVHRPRLRALELLAIGMATGALAAAVVAPLDVVVSRVVARPAVYGGGVVATLRKIVREEGLPGVWAGVRLQMAKEALGSALFFAVYDLLRERMGVPEEDDHR